MQRRWDSAKHRTWRLYVAQLEAELNVSVALVVYCPDSAVANRYRDLFEFDGISLILRPFIFTPDQMPLVLDEELARVNPGLVVLSALCHGGKPEVEAMFPALSAALQALSSPNAALDYEIILAGLPEAPRVRWEAYMTATVGSEYRSELFQELAAHNQAIGEARGEAKAVLTVLDARGIAVPIGVREQILACTDLAQLDLWLRRAGTATSTDEVLHG